MTGPTQDEYWNATAGEHWAAYADRYDEILAPFGDALIEAVAAEAGWRILDVGCGNGALAIALAKLVGPSGSVVGLDLSEPMLDTARARAGALGLDNVTFVRGDAQRHRFDAAAFDLIVSRFGVMFFDDPVAAFANLRGALADAGQMTFACWQDLLLNEWMLVPSGALVEHLGMPEMGPPGGPGPFAFADPDRVRAVVEGAGWSDVAIEGVAREQYFGADVDAAYDFFTHTNVIQGMIAEKDGPLVEAALQAMRTALQQHERADGVVLKGAIWLVTATP